MAGNDRAYSDGFVESKAQCTGHAKVWAGRLGKA